MPSEPVWTLPEAARLLNEPQHRLIYLCEKQVVVPDLAEAAGRGSSRRFSTRNLLEFAIALRLRALGLPAAQIGAILYALRGFEKRMAGEVPKMLEALRAPKGIELRAIVGDEQRVYFLIHRQRERPRLFGGISLKAVGSLTSSNLVSRLRPAFKSIIAGDNAPEGSRHVRLDVNISQIARDLNLQ